MKEQTAQAPRSVTLADLELVLALVRGRTLNGAAVRLDVDVSTVFRAIKRIEKDLGEVLFERGRQGYAPTELALELAGYAEQIESRLQEARDAVQRPAEGPSGLLRITTTDTVLHHVLMPILMQFTETCQAVELELLVSPTLASLSSRDADVAIHATRTPPEHLVGVQLGKLQSGLFASRDYLRRHEDGDVRHMDWIALDDSMQDHPSQKWRHQHYSKVRPRYRVNSAMSVASAVAAGLGVGVVPLVALRNDPQVQMMQGPVAELDTELWCLAHPDARNLQRVKSLFSFLRERVPAFLSNDAASAAGDDEPAPGGTPPRRFNA